MLWKTLLDTYNNGSVWKVSIVRSDECTIIGISRWCTTGGCRRDGTKRQASSSLLTRNTPSGWSDIVTKHEVKLHLFAPLHRNIILIYLKSLKRPNLYLIVLLVCWTWVSLSLSVQDYKQFLGCGAGEGRLEYLIHQYLGWVWRHSGAEGNTP